MSVALIGNFMYETPDDVALGSFDLLLAYMQTQRYVTGQFTLYAACEVRSTDSPGILLYRRLDQICSSPQLVASYPHICRHLVVYIGALSSMLKCLRSFAGLWRIKPSVIGQFSDTTLRARVAGGLVA